MEVVAAVVVHFLHLLGCAAAVVVLPLAEDHKWVDLTVVVVRVVP